MKRVYLFIVISSMVFIQAVAPGIHRDTNNIIKISTGPVLDKDDLTHLSLLRSSRNRPLSVKRVPESHKIVNHKRDAFDRMARCESGGNPRRVNRTGKYRGAFQFDLVTWHADPVNMPGDPIAYSYEVQKRAAKRLFAERGDSPWPSCGHYLR